MSEGVPKGSAAVYALMEMWALVSFFKTGDMYTDARFRAGTVWLIVGLVFFLTGITWAKLRGVPLLLFRDIGPSKAKSRAETNQEALSGDSKGLTETARKPLISYAGMSSDGYFAGMAFQPVWMHLVTIKNSETDVPRTAHGVRGRITYDHANGVDSFVVSPAMWRVKNESGSNVFPLQVTIKPNDVGKLVVLAEESSTKRKVVITDPSARIVTDLTPGHWVVRVTATSDNSPTLVGLGGFTVLSGDEHQLKYDEPPFSFEFANEDAQQPVLDGAPRLLCKGVSSVKGVITVREDDMSSSPLVSRDRVIGRPFFYHLKIANEPTGTVDRKVAEKVAGRVQIFHENGTPAAKERLHRWETSPGPQEVGKSADQQVAIDIPPNGVECNLDIALKYEAEDSFYTHNNDTAMWHGQSGWRDEEFKFPPGTYIAKVHLSGTNVVTDLRCQIVNKGVGSKLEITPL